MTGNFIYEVTTAFLDSFWIFNWLHLHVVGLCEESGAPQTRGEMRKRKAPSLPGIRTREPCGVISIIRANNKVSNR